MAAVFIDDRNYKEYSGDYVEFGGEKKFNATKFGKPNPGFASLPSNFKVIPFNETASRVRDMKQAGADLVSRKKRSKIKTKDQNGTNYCWVNCAASAIEYTRELQGESYRELSPAFLGNLGSNFTNSGGYVEDALELSVKYGCATVASVPTNNLSRQWYNQNRDAVFADAARHKVTNWVDLGYGGNGSLDDQVRTLLLQNQPVVVALNWWSHAILYVAVTENGDWVILNSWGDSWGEQGIGVIERRRGSPNAAFAAAASLATP